MAIDNKLLAQAREAIEGADSILLTSHVGPDGDALGSVLGLGLALIEAGKKVQMVLSDGVPTGFDHLEGVELIQRAPKSKVDLAIGVDCGDLERLGNAVAMQDHVDINIDHHVTNTHFAKINIVDPEMVATSAQIAAYLEPLGLKLTDAARDALLTGIITDSLGFHTSNMNANALEIAASLVDAGANIQDLYERALLLRSFEAMRYWGAALSRLERDGRLIWTTMTPEDRKNSGYREINDAELINTLASTEGADITVVFIEQDGKDQIKVSWRSRNGVDVATLASSFGGGGHKAASGATVKGSLEEVKEKILKASLEALEG